MSMLSNTLSFIHPPFGAGYCQGIRIGAVTFC